VGPEDYAKVFFDESVAQIYTEYQKELRRNNAVDFDDLIKYSVEIFEGNGKVLADYQDRFQYIMVDEYQDTNPSQYKLINMLAQKHQNLCVVGDDDQSIYGFRGADITNILNFEDDYPDALVLKLEQNYRSTRTIVKAANSIIQNNVKRKAKQSWTKNDRGEPIITYEAGSTYSEADYVLRHIQEYVASGYSYSDCAVLYRINSQARVFEDLFRLFSIPYRLVGDSGRYKQGNAVSMMTVHSSKGLEFPIVFRSC
jgi:DNA helicase-2/ATP-dependent DNA helicase PcrA